jgi:L-fuconate dehydratase
VVEWVDHLHEHFRHPAVLQGGRYKVPLDPGYSIEMLPESLEQYAFPNGPVWAATEALAGLP